MVDPRRLWTVPLADLGLSARPYHALIWRFRTSTVPAWYVAVLCEKCLCCTRNFGRLSFQETRAALSRAGFPPAPRTCGRQWPPPSPCVRDLERCRAMLERGEWEDTA